MAGSLIAAIIMPSLMTVTGNSSMSCSPLCFRLKLIAMAGGQYTSHLSEDLNLMRKNAARRLKPATMRQKQHISRHGVKEMKSQSAFMRFPRERMRKVSGRFS